MGGLVVSSTNSSGYVEVLHLRDLIAPTALSDIPPLTPPVRPVASFAIPADAWEAWLDDVHEAPAGDPVPEPKTPELAAAVALHGQDAAAWATEHSDDDAFSTYRPGWLPGMLREYAGDGEFECVVLPVQGTWWKDVSARRLLVSMTAYTDRPVIDGLLRERLALLLT